jgi:ATP-dependent Lhr-like helicase
MAQSTSIIRDWFKKRSWQPFPFQEEAWQAYLAGESGLIITPTGAGKSYAASLGPLIDAAARAGGRY